MVGPAGFEPATSCPPDTRANQAAPRPVKGTGYRRTGLDQTSDDVRNRVGLGASPRGSGLHAYVRFATFGGVAVRWIATDWEQQEKAAGAVGMSQHEHSQALFRFVGETKAPGGPHSLPNGANGEQQLGLTVDLTTDGPKLVLGGTEAARAGIAHAPTWKLLMKREIDVFVALIALIVAGPIMLVTAVAVALSSPGPVFFSQERVGHLGERFRFLKFRSMCHDAESRREEILHHNHHRVGPIFKVKEDPRLTPVGRAIRRFSIDELPQLFHVLTGRMSLVGPRPPLPEEVASYGDRELKRLTVRPGITCIWQVSGRSELDFDTWIDMDLEYIENWSLLLDLKILAKTIPAVVSGRGAY